MDLTDRFCVGIVGSRLRSTIRDRRFVYSLVDRLQEQYGKKLLIVSGACRSGPDDFAAEACKVLGVEILEHSVDRTTPIPNKHEYRKRAYARNSLVARDARQALFALVWEGRKGGTEDTVTKYSEFILAGERRKLYLVHTDLSVERWEPEALLSSVWEICQGNVRQLS